MVYRKRISAVGAAILLIGCLAPAALLAQEQAAEKQQPAKAAAPAQAAAEAKQEDAKEGQQAQAAPKIQMAILLDTSGSMRGLINQARAQLWKVVNEFATAKRGDQLPTVEVALYEYGHKSLGAEVGFMRQIVPLTDDLDKVSEELFKLDVGGSREYCGQVIDMATRELKWSESNRDLKSIFIAGNEPFTQGTVDFRAACHQAANKGVTVSTIYCGPNQEGVRTSWLEASRLADGSYMSIDQNRTEVAVAAPQDKELAALNSKLNSTYIAYGSDKARKEAVRRQVAQDSNAISAGGAAAATRAAVKVSRLYNNARWDLCDACRKGLVKLEDIPVDQLPAEMRKMSLAERKAHIKKMTQERATIQAKMKALTDARAKFVAAKLKASAASAENTLDVAIIGAVRKQAEAKNFSFDK